jgi:hypothetical protein
MIISGGMPGPVMRPKFIHTPFFVLFVGCASF